MNVTHSKKGRGLIDLPPLPAPSSVTVVNADPGSVELRDNYTAEQMKAYGVLCSGMTRDPLYEKLRRLNPRQFYDLYMRNLSGDGLFDDLVRNLP
jgi:hypothetical protein